ncbi:hypothetical protein BC835DRAFT_74541 [Cytidiella melzeri]|nr:hypothetical protein BC835DRAFT_74541 [Cytidiella melzeri]
MDIFRAYLPKLAEIGTNFGAELGRKWPNLDEVGVCFVEIVRGESLEVILSHCSRCSRPPPSATTGLVPPSFNDLQRTGTTFRHRLSFYSACISHSEDSLLHTLRPPPHTSFARAYSPLHLLPPPQLTLNVQGTATASVSNTPSQSSNRVDTQLSFPYIAL